MATSKIQAQKITKTESLTFTVNTNVFNYPERITGYRYGNVVAIRIWGATLKSNIANADKTTAIQGVPKCVQQGTSHIGLQGANTTNLQGNIYNVGVASTNIAIGLKNDYQADAAIYASLVYLASDE